MKPITYKDNVSELVSISVKEAMQMLMDYDKPNMEMGKLPERSGSITGDQFEHDLASSLKVSKPSHVVILDECGNEFELIGVMIKPAGFLVRDNPYPWERNGILHRRSIYRREEYVLGYNGEKLPPLPDGYGLVPENTLPVSHFSFCGLAIAIGDNEWSEHQSWAFLSKGEDGRFACKLDSDKWRALFPPELQIEEGKWYECRDGSVFKVHIEHGYHCVCSDGWTRRKNGEAIIRIPHEKTQKQAIREINPQLSLSDLDHATANRVWRAMKC